MKYPLVWLSLAALLLGACNTASPVGPAEPAALESLGTSTFRPIATAENVRFLDPIDQNPLGDEPFADGMKLEIRFFRVDANGLVLNPPGTSLGPVFRTSDGTLRVEANEYRRNWKVSDTVPAVLSPGYYLRGEIRRDIGSDEPLCNDQVVGRVFDGSCLAYFHAHVYDNGTSNIPTPQGFLRLTDSQTLPIKFHVSFGPPPASITDLVPLTIQRFELGEDVGFCAASNYSQGFSAVGAGFSAVGAGFSAVGAGFATEEQGFSAVGAGFSAVGAGFSAVGAGFSAVGAGFSAVGAAGGFFLLAQDDALSAENAGAVLVPANVVGRDLMRIRGLDYPQNNVAILVVDDFNGGRNTLPAGLFSDSLNEESFASLFTSDTAVSSHGALVMHHLHGLAVGAGWTLERESGSAGSPYFLEFVKNDVTLRIQGVPLAKPDTDAVAEAIVTAVDALAALGYGRFVVNMSFVAVPCIVYGDVPNLVSFEDYVVALARANGVGLEEYSDRFLEILTLQEALEDDELNIYLNGPPPGVVHVASAGNFANGFALFPAAHPNVISVSAQHATGVTGQNVTYGDGTSWYSNTGEILAPGLTLLTKPAAVRDSVTSANSTEANVLVAYAGTSYAAPVVSLFTALDLARTTPRCSVGVPPGLAHGDFRNDDSTRSNEDWPLLPPGGIDRTYAVDRWCAAIPTMRFDGFYDPLRQGTTNRVTFGETLPLKWSLFDPAGSPVLTPPGTIRLRLVPFLRANGRCGNVTDSPGTQGPWVEVTKLRVNSQGVFQVNYRTPSTTQCEFNQLQLSFGDGTIGTANLRFR